MTDVVNALIGASGISASTFFDQITPLVPLLVVVIPVVFVIGLFKKLTKGLSKGKLKM